MRVQIRVLFICQLWQLFGRKSSLFVHGVNQDLVCPVITNTFLGDNAVETQDDIQRLTEISGIAFSPTQLGPSGQPVFFAAGDGGTMERIFMYDSADGKRLRTLQIDRAEFPNLDWEALSMGSCGSTGVDDTCLYIMDGGDNQARTTFGEKGRSRSPYAIMKVREPTLNEFDDYDFIPPSQYSILEYNYTHPTSPARYFDCETMIVDHVGWGKDESIGDVYLLTKGRGRIQDEGAVIYEMTRLFHIPASAWPQSYGTPRTQFSPPVVGSYDFTLKPNPGIIINPELETMVIDGGEIMGNQWRGGEMSYDGTLIGIGTREYAHLFLRCPGVSVADTLAGPNATSKSCLKWPQPTGGQVESFAFTPDGMYGLEVPEGRSPGMGWTSFLYDRTNTSQRCGPISPSPTVSAVPSLSPTQPPTSSPSSSMSPSRSPTPNVCPCLQVSQQTLSEWTSLSAVPFDTGDNVTAFYNMTRLPGYQGPVPMTTDQSMIFLHRDGTDRLSCILNLVFVHNKGGFQKGEVEFEIYPGDFSDLTVLDDADDIYSYDSTTDTTSLTWGWNPEYTDGGAVSVQFNNIGDSITVSPNFVNGIDSWVWVNGMDPPGSTADLSLSANLVISRVSCN